MYKMVAVIVAVFGGIIILAGAALLIYGIKTRMRERKNCTLSTVGIVKEKLYDDSVVRVGSEEQFGPEYTTGLRMLITIDGVEHDVFNKIYDTEYYKYNVGDVVPIKVNPNNPSEYYINEGASQGMFLYLMGAGMIIGGIILIKYFWF